MYIDTEDWEMIWYICVKYSIHHFTTIYAITIYIIN